MSSVDDKRRMREDARAARARAASDAVDAPARLRDRVLEALEIELGRTPRPVVSGYWPMGDEIDVAPLLAELSRRGHVCALPVVGGRGEALIFRAWKRSELLEPGPHGTSQPGADAPEAVPAIVLTPLLAFDATGARLGYGGGYYDRTLRTLRDRNAVLAVGVAYDAQEVEAVPSDAGDERLDLVVTERRIIRRAN